MDNSIGNRKTTGGAKPPPGDCSMGGAPTMRPDRPGPAGRRFAAGDLVLGRYRVTDELGQGGMGVVYRCFDEVAGIDVALKALPPEVAHNSGEMDEVRENFRLVSKLHHPNIANINTLERDSVTGDYYLVMECVDGLDLRQWARKRRGEGRPLKLDEVVILAHSMASALDYAHAQRVIHRDIKPSNVRVNFEGDVKVLDFGLAAQLHTSLSRVSQAYRGTSGTGPYMAPEQWQGRRQGAAADQYALAASVYELLAGVPPFENHDPAVLREAVLKQDVLPLAGVPPHVNAALLRGLAKEPGGRFPDCAAFVAALGRALGRRSAECGPPQAGGERSVAVGSRSRQWKKAFLWSAASVAAAVLAYGSYRSYASHRSGRAAAEQAVSRQDAKTPRADSAAQESQRLVAERAIAEERARRAEAALAAAEKAAAEEKAKQAQARLAAEMADVDDSVRHQEVARQADAERNLKPTLTVVAEADGCEVAAQISDGQRTYKTPQAFTLEAGRRYSFVVSIESTESIRSSQSNRAKRYKPAAFEVTADWRGPQTRRVALEEDRGPIAGEPWASPATGMAFVWVPALKLWVGKYEVTNGEYRKKDLSHDSKDYKGDTLNEDRQPAVYVNFDDAKAYAGWLTGRDREQLGGLRYRVISESEWQTCAQCGDAREYPWGRAMPPKFGNYCGQETAGSAGSMIDNHTDGFAVTCPVERSGENEWGLYGIGGNAWECCASDASGSVFGAWRGASWYSSTPGYLRCAYRNFSVGSGRYDYYGIRLVLSR
jgi:formylglycine-generating enzyme required for sulfatase activity